MCSPLPAKFGRGLGEKSAHRPLRAALVRTTAQKVVLARALRVVGALRPDAHLLQRQADLAADVLAAVLGGYVHVARVVVGDAGRLAVLVALEDVKLHLGAEGKAVARVLGPLHGAAQQRAGVRLKGAAVGILYVAEEPDDLAVFGPPGQLCKRARVGVQEHIRAHLAAEARDGRGVYRDA